MDSSQDGGQYAISKLIGPILVSGSRETGQYCQCRLCKRLLNKVPGVEEKVAVSHLDSIVR